MRTKRWNRKSSVSSHVTMGANSMESASIYTTSAKAAVSAILHEAKTAVEQAPPPKRKDSVDSDLESSTSSLTSNTPRYIDLQEEMNFYLNDAKESQRDLLDHDRIHEIEIAEYVDVLLSGGPLPSRAPPTRPVRPKTLLGSPLYERPPDSVQHMEPPAYSIARPDVDIQGTLSHYNSAMKASRRRFKMACYTSCVLFVAFMATLVALAVLGDRGAPRPTTEVGVASNLRSGGAPMVGPTGTPTMAPTRPVPTPSAAPVMFVHASGPTMTSALVVAAPTRAPHSPAPTRIVDDTSLEPTTRQSAAPNGADSASLSPTQDKDTVMIQPLDESSSPTSRVTVAPTTSPIATTRNPTVTPSSAPVQATMDPTSAPVHPPTMDPTSAPMKKPTHGPTSAPVPMPSMEPSMPTASPSLATTSPTATKECVDDADATFVVNGQTRNCAWLAGSIAHQLIECPASCALTCKHCTTP